MIDEKVLIERLEGLKGIAFLTLANNSDKKKDILYDEVMAYLNTSIDIVKLLAEESKGKDTNVPSNNGWIPCSERLPEIGQLVMWSVNTEKHPCASQHIILGSYDGYYESEESWKSLATAWQPLPPKYEPKEVRE